MKVLVIFIRITFSFVDAFNSYSGWETLNKRPLPDWYDGSKLGILLHWGVYSVPAFASRTAGSESFVYQWKTVGDREVLKYVNKNFPPEVSYKAMASNFTAQFFYPLEWAQLFKEAGMKYVVVTAKTQDGFILFDHKSNSFDPFKWSAANVGANKDLVKELRQAVKRKRLKFGVYYSLSEWYSKLYLSDKSRGFSSDTYIARRVLPHLIHLVNTYKPSIIWADGSWDEGATSKYFKSEQFLTWLYNESPVKNEVVVNDRWGFGMTLRCGDFYTGPDRYNPRRRLIHKWEYAFSLDKHSCGYSKNRVDLMNFDELLETIVSTVSYGGNAMITIGPTHEGEIPEPFQKLLIALGKWLRINGEAIYGTKPWLHHYEKEYSAWYTCKPNQNYYNKYYNHSDPLATPRHQHLYAIYVIFFYWPETSIIKLKQLRKLFSFREQYVELLDTITRPIDWWELTNEAVVLKLPERRPTEDYGWTLRITRVKRKGYEGDYD